MRVRKGGIHNHQRRPLLSVGTALQTYEAKPDENWLGSTSRGRCLRPAFANFGFNIPLTLASGPLKVDWEGWLKNCKLRFEYFRKVSAVRRARVQALRKASFCSWCLLISCVIRVTLSTSPEDKCFCSMSSSRLYSRSRLSSTEQTCK